MISSIIHTIRDKRFSLNRRQDTSSHTQGGHGTAPLATGVNTTIWDKGFGFIGRDNKSGRTDLYFHRTEVDGDGFDGLREGQHVVFDEEADPNDRNHQRAVNVRPAAGGENG